MTELSKMRWHCRRGVKELDIVLNKYLDEYYEHADDNGKTAFKAAFKELLNLEDPVLYAMLLGNVEPMTPEQGAVLEKLGNMFNKNSTDESNLTTVPN